MPGPIPTRTLRRSPRKELLAKGNRLEGGLGSVR
jgi:hypothetical protein